MVEKFKEELSSLNKSLENTPNNAQALSARGNIYRMMKKYEEALKDLDKALEIDPNNCHALGNVENVSSNRFIRIMVG
ncbi:7827_t:CDS:2 [Cetraspora pellucida]|uniref:7827_t:CDS:1 n=1 Tax=Cetraspora pellucida TaxID=1433469 RepID=A0A9N9IBI2_9GLOM|nr:7827_t:CDS:2 [Cetraspora pellucida]